MDEYLTIYWVHRKYIGSLCSDRYILTLSLLCMYWLKTCNLWVSCCNFCSCMLCNFYQIESYQSSFISSPLIMGIIGTLILLYFKEMPNCVRYHNRGFLKWNLPWLICLFYLNLLPHLPNSLNLHSVLIPF